MGNRHGRTLKPTDSLHMDTTKPNRSLDSASALPHEVLIEVATYLGMFGVDGMLFVNRQFSAAASYFVSTRRITTLLQLHVSGYVADVHVRAWYWTDGRQWECEQMMLPGDRYAELIHLLLRDTVRCEVYGPIDVIDVFRGFGSSFAVKGQLELQRGCFGSLDRIVEFLALIHKVGSLRIVGMCVEDENKAERLVAFCRAKGIRRVEGTVHGQTIVLLNQ